MLAQIIGLVAVAIGFASYQVRSKKMLLLIQTVSCLVMTVHYFMLGATSALVLNGVVILRNVAYCFRDRRIFSGRFFPVLFALVITALGALSWQGWYSLFIMAGLAVNTLCLAIPDPQKVRASVVLTSSAILVYHVIVFSIGGMFNEIVSVISAVIGLIRYRRKPEKPA
jgi:hypothetical protein